MEADSAGILDDALHEFHDIVLDVPFANVLEVLDAEHHLGFLFVDGRRHTHSSLALDILDNHVLAQHKVRFDVPTEVTLCWLFTNLLFEHKKAGPLNSFDLTKANTVFSQCHLQLRHDRLVVVGLEKDVKIVFGSFAGLTP
jgi:hypothetical protein